MGEEGNSHNVSGEVRLQTWPGVHSPRTWDEICGGLYLILSSREVQGGASGEGRRTGSLLYNAIIKNILEADRTEKSRSGVTGIR